MDEDGALFDSGFDGGGPFRVTPEAGGVSLESALRDFGPAAIDDLIPRLRAIAHVLDAAHAAGAVHGALHPSKVIVHDAATSVIAGTTATAPYAAPELAGGGAATPAADQFSLAAIAYEWLLGRPIDHPATRPVEVRTMPGVDRAALSKAFTRALAPKPRDRFASCTEFCDAVAASTTPELPLLAFDHEPEIDDPVEPFVPEAPAPFDAEPENALLAQNLRNVDDVKIVAEESFLTAAQPDLDTIDPALTEPAPVPVASWNPGPSHPVTTSRGSQRFGGFALILATLVGAIFGFAAGYMARPRALQGGAPQQMAPARVPEAPSASGAPVAPATPAPQAPKTPQAPVNVGRLLVRSSPSGASVSVDGIARGVTPLALGDVEMGTRNVVVTRPGYLPESRKVVITSARPARSLDVRLSASAAASPRPATPATLGRPAAATGSLTVESRPTGAAVTINGTPRGNTPLTLTDLGPGEYRILMTMPGYRNLATTVRVVAGERVRAAASLTALEQQ